MERLTYKNEAGKVCTTYIECIDEKKLEYSGEAIERLAAYEATGYEPKEISVIQSEIATLSVALSNLNRMREVAREVLGKF